jgi:hypothetical protein
VIWRLGHPIRGLVAGFVVFVVICSLVGFGMGLPELLVAAIISGIAFVLASRDSSSAWAHLQSQPHAHAAMSAVVPMIAATRSSANEPWG